MCARVSQLSQFWNKKSWYNLCILWLRRAIADALWPRAALGLLHAITYIGIYNIIEVGIYTTHIDVSVYNFYSSNAYNKVTWVNSCTFCREPLRLFICYVWFLSVCECVNVLLFVVLVWRIVVIGFSCFCRYFNLKIEWFETCSIHTMCTHL